MQLLVALICACCLIVAGCSSSRSLSSKAPSHVKSALDEAEDLLGTNYCARGTTPDCFDCSGFTSWCFLKAGIQLPRTSSDQYTVGKAVQRTALEPGDLVFFRTSGSGISHVGIAVDRQRFIHASTSSGVMISSFDDSYWRPRYVGARRIGE